MARRNSVAIPWLYRGVGGSVLVLSWSRRRSPARSSFGLGMRRHGPFVANCMYLNIKRLSSLARALSHHTSSASSILPLDLLPALALTTRQYYTPEPLTYTPSYPTANHIHHGSHQGRLLAPASNRALPHLLWLRRRRTRYVVTSRDAYEQHVLTLSRHLLVLPQRARRPRPGHPYMAKGR